MKVLKEQYDDDKVMISQTDEGTVLMTRYLSIATNLPAVLSQSKHLVTGPEQISHNGTTIYKIVVKGTTDLREVLPYLIGYDLAKG